MSDTEIRKLEDQSAINRILVAQSGIIIQDAKEKIVLTYKDWLALKRKLAAHDSPAGEIFDAAIDEGMLWLPVDARVFPDILPYLNRHKAYFDRLTNARAELLGVMAINPGAASFIEGVSKLIDKGFVTTIDYGGTSEIHAEHIRGTRGAFRMYPTQPKKMSAFSRPGLFDVTSDVNFTDLALVGEKNGLLPVFYGSQTALRRTPIFFAPQKVATSFEVFNEAFAAIVNLTDINELEKNIHFKMLIQKKGMAAKHVYCLDRPSESLIPQ